MKPSEMTDDQLRLAIAEELGWTRKSPTTCIWHPPGSGGVPGSADYLPNWPDDNNAAFELPLETNEEKRKFAIELAKIVIPDTNIGTAGIVYEAAFVTARQRSEAWLTARRNDG